MSRSALVILACLVLGAPARGSGDLTVHVQAGWAIPTDPPEFSDLWNGAASLGGGIGVRLAPEWELVGSLHYQKFAADAAAHRRELLLVSPSGEPTEIRSMDGRDARVVTLLGEIRFLFPVRSARYSPFLSFGAGYFDLSVSPATFVPESPGAPQLARFPAESDSGLGASIGGGVGMGLSPTLRLTVDCIYTVGFTEGVSTQFLPLRLGLVIG